MNSMKMPDDQQKKMMEAFKGCDFSYAKNNPSPLNTCNDYLLLGVDR